MKQVSIKLQSILLGILYGTMCSSPALAEDIEIYSTTLDTSVSATANILFALDTSGSMGASVFTAPPPYDYTRTYIGCYNPARLYTQISMSARYVGGVRFTGPEMYCHPSGSSYGYNINTRDQFNTSAFKCDRATSALETSGFYIDRIAQYRSNRWRSVNGIDSNKLTQNLDCKKDQGTHGENSGDGQPYVTNKSGAGGWKSGSSQKVNWNSTGSGETVYSGNYLNHLVEEPGSSVSRLEVMKNALTDVIGASTGINVGLMRYSRDAEGGLVVTPMGEIDATKPAFLNELAKMYASGGTPLAESYYEAVSYMQGNSVDYGNSSTVRQYISPPGGSTEDISRLSHSGSRTSAGSSTYKSPISDTCQKNFIVLLTDGLPSSDYGVDSTRRSKIGVTETCSARGTSSCLEEIAHSIGSNDQSPSPAGLGGDQFISTFTIGLDIASADALLQGTANASKAATGTGEYYPASDAVSLTAAFASIVTLVLETDTSFSSPAVSVNAFNRSTHLDDLYFTLFKPGNNEHWAGNLKKYKLKFFTDTLDEDGDGDDTERLPFIADTNTDSPAVNSSTGAIAGDTGFFKTSAQSFWTPTGTTDGSDVTMGGAVSVLTNTRNIYTTTESYTTSAGSGVFVPSTPVLTTTINAVDKTNLSLTDALLDTTGLPDKVTGIPYRETLIDWSNGLDVFDDNSDGDVTDAFRFMGDPLHAEPALVQYGETGGIPDLTAFVATNDGYLHAFDGVTGNELFSFIPQELLTNLSFAMENNGTDKLYGLDGSVAAWIEDDLGDGTIAGADDHVYLYFGMRRGGNNIYAMDVTIPASPKLLWVIKGGFGDYAELGETWSTINVEKVNDGGTEKTVLVFGGGYDTDQDDVNIRTKDDIGRAVYIADATTGERLWMGSDGGNTNITEMEYSIPARVKPLDISGDGLMDRIYAVDMGGQIFRFDIDNGSGSLLAGSITGGRIADLAKDSVAADARRFYYPPDVALIEEDGGKYHGMVITSGYRAHPLSEETHDRIYLLKDRDTGRISTGYTTLTETDLADVTVNLAGGEGVTGVDDTVQKAELARISSAEGWYINLDDETTGTWVGEKGLAEPLIIEGTAIVTTYVPDFTVDIGDKSCAPKAGDGKVFFLDIADATPAFPADVDKRANRHITLKRSGIPPTPRTIITEAPVLCVGTECTEADFGLGIRKTFWHEVEN